jgi:hypothetical protein
MADRYLLESGAPDGYQLEDGSGVYLLDIVELTPALFVNSQTFYTPTIVDPAEIILNGTANDGTNNWTGPITVDVGEFKVTSDGASGAGVQSQNGVLTVGERYRFRAVMTPHELDRARIRFFTNFSTFPVYYADTVGGVVDFTFVADGANIQVNLEAASISNWASNGEYAKFDNISLKPIPSLGPSLFVNSQTFYIPTIAPGAVALTPALYADGDTFFTPIVTSLNTLTPALFSDSDTFFSPTVTASKTLSPSLFANAQTFYIAVLSASYSLVPALYIDGDIFYVPTVTTSYALTAPLYVNGQVFYSPTVAFGAQTLQPSLFVNSPVFNSPTVNASYQLVPDTYSDADTFYSPTITPGIVSILPALFANPNTFYLTQVLSTSGGSAAAGVRVTVAFFRG